MRRRDAIALIGSVAVCPASAFGQQSNKVPRIGWIILGSPAGTHPDIFSYFDSFRSGLHDMGYVEGTNLAISSKDAEGVPERLPKLIDELIGENVSIIVSPGPAIMVVREKVQSIPVVFAFSGDPVLGGLVDTLAHGRGNLTGLTYMAVQLNEKRLDLLKELSPSISQVTLLTDPIPSWRKDRSCRVPESCCRSGYETELSASSHSNRVRRSVSDNARRANRGNRRCSGQFDNVGTRSTCPVRYGAEDSRNFRMERICPQWRTSHLRS